MENVKIFKHRFTFLIFAKKRPVITKATNAQTQNHRAGDKATDIGKIADLLNNLTDAKTTVLSKSINYYTIYA